MSVAQSMAQAIARSMPVGLPVGRIGKIHVPKPNLAAHRVHALTRAVPRAVYEVRLGLPNHLQALHGALPR